MCNEKKKKKKKKKKRMIGFVVRRSGTLMEWTAPSRLYGSEEPSFT